jgi:hypothetical protein
MGSYQPFGRVLRLIGFAAFTGHNPRSIVENPAMAAAFIEFARSAGS